ncbi:hypothetical protein [Geothermobacter hydrogeniphilus]|nr:hypothetical protein [Geothermobacter hydrogeniphilus]
MDSGAMQMLGATGGLMFMVYYLLMLVLSILVPFFVWRIWKWSYATSQELKQLNEKFDQFLSQQQAGVPVEEAAESTSATTAFAPAAWEPEEEKTDPPPAGQDDNDPLAAAFDLDEATEQEQEAPATEQTTEMEPATVTETAADDSPRETGFEFAVSPEEAFGEETTEESQAPAADAFAFEEEQTGDDADPFAEASDNREPQETAFGGDDSALEFTEDEDAEAANLDQQFDSAFNHEESAEDSATETTDDPFAGFGEQPPAEEKPAPGTPAEKPVAAPAEEAAVAETEPVEEKPAIIALEPDPQRPTVKLARCGQCNHKLAYKETLSGKKARCPSCRSAFVLP